jgi:hypothetical protein
MWAGTSGRRSERVVAVKVVRAVVKLAVVCDGERS